MNRKKPIVPWDVLDLTTGKSYIVEKAAKKAGLKVVKAKLAKVKPESYKGLPKMRGE